MYLRVYLYLCQFFSDQDKDSDALGEEKDVETAQEKRLRLAKQYLAQLEDEGYEEFDQ